MTFFARRGNGHDADIDAAVAVPQPGVPGPPPMADAMLRKMLGVGFSDLQQIADQAGHMLNDFNSRLSRIEAQNTEILARLEYLAVRDRPK